MKGFDPSNTYAVAAMLLSNAIAGAGFLLLWASFSSGDPSGLQYLGLYIGGAALVVAGVVSLLAKWVENVPIANLPLIGAGLVIVLLPQIPGIGYNSSLIDDPGAALSVLLLAADLVLSIYIIYRVVMSRTHRHHV